MPSVHPGDHQGGTMRKLAVCLSLLTNAVSSGVAHPFAILGCGATFFDGRPCVQRDVHPEEHGAHTEHLRTPS